ncbi:MAG: O-antigen ligase family protein [Solirubrobacteraceae bacterium]|nr:O-antigen ligase family protein [Solirubrobacteraceae bacterium]
MSTTTTTELAEDGRDLRWGGALGLLLLALSVVGGTGLASSRAAIVNTIGVVVGLALVLFCREKGGRQSFRGQWSVALFAVFVAFSGFSITWSVDPAATWEEVNRLLSYLAAFTGAVVVARAFPQRWRSVLLALAVSSVLVSLVAMLSKVSPELFAPSERYARLREPLQYWNAVGLIGAFGVPIWLYYGTRRHGKPVLDILAAPALTILFVTVLLAYSRGALIAGAIGIGVWLLLAPARLKSVAVMVVPLIGAAVIILWAFGQPDLTTDDVDLLLRETAGHRFGVVMFTVLLLVTFCSFLVQFVAATRGPNASWRRRIGAVLLGAALLVPVAGLAALSQSQQGLGGTISSGWKKLTDPNENSKAGSAPANSPNRLTQAGNARSLYWRDAFRVWKERPAIGAGANGYGTARLKVRSDTGDVVHAHGFVVQTLADLGVVGVLMTVLLLGAWGIGVRRTLGSRGQPWPPERVGAVALFAAVITYGAHSFLDWTWSFPAATLPALIAAGWLVGRGPIAEPQQLPDVVPALEEDGWVGRLGRWTPRVQLAAFMLLSVWSIWQPYRAFLAGQSAISAVAEGRIDDAVKLGDRAVSEDPVSLDAASAKATALAAGGDIAAARDALEGAIAMQPENPAGWQQLLDFELGPAADAERAAAAYKAAVYLNPLSPSLKATIESALTAPAVDAAPTDAASTTTAPADGGVAP